jgi:hypothetical protein
MGDKSKGAFQVLAKVFDLLASYDPADLTAAAKVCPEPDVAKALRAFAKAQKEAASGKRRNQHAGLFRHGAVLARRSQGQRVPACGVPTIFEFEATALEVKLHSFGDTSPFHDLPDGAHVYVEIGVDMDWVRDKQPDVAKAVEDFERHGRRPKFGPLADLDAPGDD